MLTPRETDFHMTTRLCLQQIREAMLHHRWVEAAEYLSSFAQTLEETSGSSMRHVPEIIWRIGTEILHYHPNTRREDYSSLYELMKHSGVKHYLMICMEHSFHLMVNGLIDEAQLQLSIAESWRYGNPSEEQAQRTELMQAYRSMLDYITWCDKKATQYNADDPDACETQEMNIYFRKSTIGLKGILKNPGVWDPFILSYVNMLEFHNDHDGALEVLNNYAYDDTFPQNPNAHIYLYRFLKKQGAPGKKLMKVLKILHKMVPSHEMMLEYFSLLLKSETVDNVHEALGVILDMLDYACWNSSLDVWNCLKTVIDNLKLQDKDWEDIILQKTVPRKDWWPALHFTSFHARKDAAENPELMRVKTLLAGILYPDHACYYTAGEVTSGASTCKTKGENIKALPPTKIKKKNS
ncbi:TATA box-binding protein-associated factor RNA polymerase I subunit A isoform X2 [Lampris incognitus]|uniref:TATA box-binding protein-associated factor RNA polymerase I subunit A isoform X2 n=1 Tax=Lampris incognitus TaxID=2546036 RepID=UPI0024B629EA|nr:TATA box-binding protein-associated factor RNA polymerase I subunit A isoform X2 [Lampris incognitus]